MMKKVVIIGANSRIARNFKFYLERKKDIEMKLYDVQESNADRCSYSYRQINFLDVDSIKMIDFNCDYVFIFSGKTGASKGFYDTSGFIDVNEKLLLNILNEIIRQKTDCRVIYPSSRLVYSDETSGPLKESNNLFPKSIYAAEKIAAENYIRIYNMTFGLKYTLFRIAIPFGELNPSISEYGIIANLINQAKNNRKITLYGNGDSVRTFTHISDICRLLWEGGTDDRTINDVFNIGGHVYSMYELSTRIGEKYDSEVVNVEWPKIEECVEVRNGWLDSEKLDQLIHTDYIDIEL